MVDDAYFGLVYEDGIMKESIFSRLAKAHPSILAIKVDGATKEDFAWGFRVGFLTYGFKGGTSKALGALADKTAGLVRGSISNASHLSQSCLLAPMKMSVSQWKSESTRRLRLDMMRFVVSFESTRVRHVVQSITFQSGYFLCVKPVAASLYRAQYST